MLRLPVLYRRQRAQSPSGERANEWTGCMLGTDVRFAAPRTIFRRFLNPAGMPPAARRGKSAISDARRPPGRPKTAPWSAAISLSNTAPSHFHMTIFVRRGAFIDAVARFAEHRAQEQCRLRRLVTAPLQATRTRQRSATARFTASLNRPSGLAQWNLYRVRRRAWTQSCRGSAYIYDLSHKGRIRCGQSLENSRQR